MRAWIASAGLSLFLFSAAFAQAQQSQETHSDLSRIGRRDLSSGSLDLYSRQKEFEIGKEMAEQVETLVTVDSDPGLNAYVRQLTERITRHSDARIPIQVRVILSNEVDAFALPGGILYVTTGLILQTQSEAELAGVIAHEVAHIAARDMTREMTQEKLWTWASVPLLFVGGPLGAGIRDSIALGGPLSLMMFSREAERKADFHGLQYLYQAGYDPVALVDFFERARKLEQDPHGAIARAFSTHPMTKDRVKDAERAIQRDLPPRAEYVETTWQYAQERANLEQFLRDEMPLVSTPPPLPELHKQTGKKNSRSKDRE